VKLTTRDPLEIPHDRGHLRNATASRSEGRVSRAAALLRPLLDNIDGFVSIERFESLTQPGKILSLSFWRDEEAVRRWRNVDAHRQGQHADRKSIFRDNRFVRAGTRISRMESRAEAPEDSRNAHGA
jgi:heme-degrading monooxygenase HmoA